MRTRTNLRWTCRLALGVAVCFTASTALAGVYVSGPLPSEFGGGFISPNPDVTKGVGKASKEGAKLAAGVSKCFSKGAKNFSKGKATGVDLCINDVKKGVLTKYDAKIAKIESKTPLPPCHDYVADGPVILNLVKSFNGLIYCQSPSGAFLDSASM